MRSALTSLLCGLAIAVMVLAVPAKALAADVPFFFGPVLPCTGFFKISQTVKSVDPQGPVDNPATPQDERRYITENLQFQAVSTSAVPNNPNSSDQGRGGMLPQCESLCDVFVLVNNLLKLAISVLVTIFTPIMLLIGGFYVMFSGGNPGHRTTGKKIITGTLVGLAIAICSALIVSQFMTFIFEREWGQAIKDQIASQPDTGIKPADVPNFGWNTISCRPTSGGVTVTTGNSSTGGGGNNTGGGNTSGSGSTSAATPGSCYSDADKARRTCALGWIRPTGGLHCLPAEPNYCRMRAAADTCYPPNAIDQNSYECSGTWTTSPTCKTIFGQNTTYKECVGGTNTNTPTQPEPAAAPPTAACSQAGGTACLGTAACGRTGTQVGAPSALGCTGSRICCRQNTR